MYFDFDFNRDTNFFEQSSTINYIKEQLKENKQLKSIDPDILNVSIKLWAESVIKHNLDINMTRIDHINLISNQNSKEVIDVIGSIMFKSKHERSDEEFKTLKMQGMVSNYMDMIVLSTKDDLCNDLKTEYVDYQNLKLQQSNKPKIK